MKMTFKAIAHSWVAPHPSPIGVVEFVGGALYGLLPTVSYRHFLSCLYKAGYTIVAMPFPFGFNHEGIARGLLDERQQIRAELSYPPELPDFWVGHSVGCKYIALLEAMGAILDQPSLLLAPDISDMQDALPFPALATWFDRLSLGIRPNRAETQAIIRESKLFSLTAVVSFASDDIAGNASQPGDRSDVAWFIQELSSRVPSRFAHQELPGGHREPIGVRIGRSLVRPDLKWGMVSPLAQRQLDSVAIALLTALGKPVGQENREESSLPDIQNAERLRDLRSTPDASPASYAEPATRLA